MQLWRKLGTNLGHPYLQLPTSMFQRLVPLPVRDCYSTKRGKSSRREGSTRTALGKRGGKLHNPLGKVSGKRESAHKKCSCRRSLQRHEHRAGRVASPAAAVLERRQRSGPHAHRAHATPQNPKRSFEITNQHHLLPFTITMHARRSARAFHTPQLDVDRSS